MNKRILYVVIGFILIVIAVYLLLYILETVPEASDVELINGAPETTGDWYLAKLFGCLFLVSLGLAVAIMNLVRLFNGKTKEE